MSLLYNGELIEEVLTFGEAVVMVPANLSRLVRRDDDIKCGIGNPMLVSLSGRLYLATAS